MAKIKLVIVGCSLVLEKEPKVYSRAIEEMREEMKKSFNPSESLIPNCLRKQNPSVILQFRFKVKKSDKDYNHFSNLLQSAP